MNEVSTNRWGDLMLQIVFVLALIGLVLIFYFSRIAGSKADDKNAELTGETLETAYQFEQAELNIEGRLKVLKVDYANDVVVYQDQLRRINNSLEYSELEKREKLKVLEDLYSDGYFKRKQDLIDQEYLKLENLRRMECRKFCSIDDLDGSSISLETGLNG